MNYIDAEKLIAEIERLLKCTEQHRGEAVADGSRQTLYWIKNFITSLQQEQPKVEVEKITKYSRIKELPDGFEKEWLCYYHKNPEYNSAKFSHLSLIEREYIIARHFYELGKNARK